MKKIRMKSGSLELELETDDLAVDLPIAVETIKSLAAIKSVQPASPPSDVEEVIRVVAAADVPSQHMNSYVAKLNANTGRKILQAAAFHLSLNDNRESFSRDELYGRARDAREWKGDYGNQQATNVARMVKSGELIERSSGVYTVPQKHLDGVKQVLSA